MCNHRCTVYHGKFSELQAKVVPHHMDEDFAQVPLSKTNQYPIWWLCNNNNDTDNDNNNNTHIAPHTYELDLMRLIIKRNN